MKIMINMNRRVYCLKHSRNNTSFTINTSVNINSKIVFKVLALFDLHCVKDFILNLTMPSRANIRAGLAYLLNESHPGLVFK